MRAYVCAETRVWRVVRGAEGGRGRDGEDESEGCGIDIRARGEAGRMLGGSRPETGRGAERAAHPTTRRSSGGIRKRKASSSYLPRDAPASP